MSLVGAVVGYKSAIHYIALAHGLPILRKESGNRNALYIGFSPIGLTYQMEGQAGRLNASAVYSLPMGSLTKSEGAGGFGDVHGFDFRLGGTWYDPTANWLNHNPNFHDYLSFDSQLNINLYTDGRSASVDVRAEASYGIRF